MKLTSRLIWAILACILIVIVIVAVRAVLNRRNEVAEHECTDHLFKLHRALTAYEAHYGRLPFDEDNWRIALADFDLLPDTSPNDAMRQSWIQSLYCCSHATPSPDLNRCYTTYFLVVDGIQNREGSESRQTNEGLGSCVAMIVELPERTAPARLAIDLTLSDLEEMCSNGFFPTASSCNRGILFSDGTIARQLKPIPFDKFKSLFGESNDVKTMLSDLTDEGYLEEKVSGNK